MENIQTRKNNDLINFKIIKIRRIYTYNGPIVTNRETSLTKNKGLMYVSTNITDTNQLQPLIPFQIQDSLFRIKTSNCNKKKITSKHTVYRAIFAGVNFELLTELGTRNMLAD